MVRVDPTDGRVDVVVLTPGCPNPEGEEDEFSKFAAFLFSKQKHSNISLILCKKLLDTSQNLLFIVILDEERGVLSELGF